MTRLLDRCTWLGLALTIGPLLLWGGVSVARLTHACDVSWWLAWIPAVATSGVMIAATKLAMTPTLNRRIRSYAGWLSAGGIVADIAAAGTQHWLEAQHLAPAPEMAAVMGGLPSLMGGLLVHIVAMVGEQGRREREAKAAADVEAAERERRRLQAEADAEAAKRRADAEHQRRVRREEELAEAERRKAAAAKERAAAELALAEVRAGQVAAVQRAEAGVADLSARREARGGKPAAQTTARRPAPVRDAAIRWLRAQRRAGRDITGIGPAEVAAAIGGSRETVKKSLPEWRAAVLAVEAVAG